jgi:Uma2 family endonuclease
MGLAAPPPSRPLTAEALMAMPEDGIDRELIRGELREKPAYLRSPGHSGAQAKIAYLLLVWLDRQTKPRGSIASGQAPFRLVREPVTFVGIDVAYASAEQVAAANDNKAFFDGPPVLAVEILSHSDTHGEITEKVDLYLEVGTVVWVVDPDSQTIMVRRPGQVPKMHTTQDDLTGDPELPGLRVSVADIFGD